MTEGGNESVARDIDRLSIELRVSAPDLDPDRITRMFGVQPTHAARRGEAIDIDRVMARISRLVIWPSCSKASSGSPGVAA